MTTHNAPSTVPRSNGQPVPNPGPTQSDVTNDLWTRRTIAEIELLEAQARRERFLADAAQGEALRVEELRDRLSWIAERVGLYVQLMLDRLTDEQRAKAAATDAYKWTHMLLVWMSEPLVHQEQLDARLAELIEDSRDPPPTVRSRRQFNRGQTPLMAEPEYQRGVAAMHAAKEDWRAKRTGTTRDDLK